ncbi:MAG: trigger factor [Oscillospiraceae bacterium]|nr:trigger factor [Oscillospiraceae bacterium]
MSLKSIDTASEKNVAVIEFDIAKDVFDATVTKIFRSKASNITVPGFRKGKAPRNIIEKMYGKGMFYEDALEELMPAAVDDAIKESKIEAVSKPEVDLKSLDENGVILTAKVFVKPEAEIKNYKGLEATKTIITVSEDDINKEVEKIQKRNARSVEITDRSAQIGDNVKIDFDGFIDGEAFEGGDGRDYNLKLGSGQFIPGFEEQIAGKNIGEDFDVNVTFPKDYHDEKYSDKEAVFKVKLNEIRFEELPELDDEFAQDVSEFNTLDEYKADLKAKMEKTRANQAETALEEQLVDGLIANLEVDIPEVMIADETNNQLQDYAYRMQSQGIDMDLYFKYTGMTVENLKAQFKETAERQVKTRLALEKIVQLENIEASEEDVDKEYDKICETYKMEKDDAKSKVDADLLKKDITVRKAVEFIKENANITTVEKTSEEYAKEHEHDHHHHDHDGHDHHHDGDFDGFDDDDEDTDETDE